MGQKDWTCEVPFRWSSGLQFWRYNSGSTSPSLLKCPLDGKCDDLLPSWSYGFFGESYPTFLCYGEHGTFVYWRENSSGKSAVFTEWLRLWRFQTIVWIIGGPWPVNLSALFTLRFRTLSVFSIFQIAMLETRAFSQGLFVWRRSGTGWYETAG